MSTLRPALLSLSLAMGLALASAVPCAAQSKGAAAETLFEEGRKAMAVNDHATACARFRESLRIDPAPGTVMNLARCEEARGRIATAWELYRRAFDELPASDDRRPVVSKHAEALAPRLPRLTLRVGAGAPPGLVVRVGDVELRAGSLGIPLPMDPGKHDLHITAPGRTSRTLTVELSEKQQRDLEIVAGEPLDADSPQPAAPGSNGSSRATIGWIVGSVGLAGLAAGSITGLMALDRKSTVDDNCDADKLCTPQGTEAADSGRTLSRWSTAGFIVGAAGVGIGAYLLLSGPSADGTRSALTAAPTRGGAQVRWSTSW